MEITESPIFESLAKSHPEIPKSEIATLNINGTRVSICQRDMTHEETDAITNAANRYLKHGGGLAGAISRTGGKKIDEESEEIIKKQGIVKVGTAVSTSSGDLPCKYVIHTVGPIWGDYKDKNTARKLLKNCVKSVIKKANELKIKSVSIPPVSSGIFGYPKELCAEDILGEIRRILIKEKKEGDSVEYIRVTMRDDISLEIFAKEFERIKGEFEGSNEEE